MRPLGSAKSLEQRRRRALTLLDRGLAMKDVASRAGVSIASVCRWRQASTAGGAAGLAAKPVPGRPRKLQDVECQRLLKLLQKGPKRNGYPDDRWTLKLIARLIDREFGVTYHPNHIWRLLRRAGWSG